MWIYSRAIVLISAILQLQWNGLSASIPIDIKIESAVTITNSGATWSGWGGVNYIFAFGDSYSTIHFNPETSPWPSSSNRMGLQAPGLPSSNGPNYLAHLTHTFLVPSYSKIKTYNFAVGGATIAREIVSPPSNSFKTFEEQVDDWFVPYFGNNSAAALAPALAPNGTRAATVDWKGEDSLFVIWFGINDLRLSYNNQTSMHALMEAYFAQVHRLHHLGARNFLFLTVPPVHLAPQYVPLQPTEKGTLGKYITDYNDALRRSLQGFQSHINFPANSLTTTTNSFLYDTGTPMLEIIKKPAVYNLSSQHLDKYCNKYHPYEYNKDWNTMFDGACGVPVNQYLWLDRVHPTSVLHKVWGEGVMRLLSV